jgi:hypothetical protein
MHAAIFLAPEAGPDPLISREPFVRLEIGIGRIAALVAPGIEQPNTWDKAKKSYKRGEQKAERPAYEAAQNKDGDCGCCPPLPPPRDAETFGNPVHLVVHGPVDAPANLMSAMGGKRTKLLQFFDRMQHHSAPVSDALRMAVVRRVLCSYLAGVVVFALLSPVTSNDPGLGWLLFPIVVPFAIIFSVPLAMFYLGFAYRSAGSILSHPLLWSFGAAALAGAYGLLLANGTGMFEPGFEWVTFFAGVCGSGVYLLRTWFYPILLEG